MLDALAKLLGLSRTEAAESLYSERAARHVLTRRSAIGLAGAMCAGTVLGEAPAPLVDPRAVILRAIQDEMDRAEQALWRTMQRYDGHQWIAITVEPD